MNDKITRGRENRLPITTTHRQHYTLYRALLNQILNVEEMSGAGAEVSA